MQKMDLWTMWSKFHPWVQFRGRNSHNLPHYDVFMHASHVFLLFQTCPPLVLSQLPHLQGY
jgi:hypothetical protein